MIRLVSCYTFLSECRLPWPSSNCPNHPTPFVVPDEPGFDALSPLSIHLASHVLLTKMCPLVTHPSQSVRSHKHPTPRAHWEFEDRARACRSRTRWSISLPDPIGFNRATAILGEISSRTSYFGARLVFRPFARVSETICALVVLHPSTGISPGFRPLWRRSHHIGSVCRRSLSEPMTYCYIVGYRTILFESMMLAFTTR